MTAATPQRITASDAEQYAEAIRALGYEDVAVGSTHLCELSRNGQPLNGALVIVIGDVLAQFLRGERPRMREWHISLTEGPLPVRELWRTSLLDPPSPIPVLNATYADGPAKVAAAWHAWHHANGGPPSA